MNFFFLRKSSCFSTVKLNPLLEKVLVPCEMWAWTPLFFPTKVETEARGCFSTNLCRGWGARAAPRASRATSTWCSRGFRVIQNSPFLGYNISVAPRGAMDIWIKHWKILCPTSCWSLEVSAKTGARIPLLSHPLFLSLSTALSPLQTPRLHLGQGNSWRKKNKVTGLRDWSQKEKR